MRAKHSFVESFSLSLFLYLDLYVLGDDAWISQGSFMQTKHQLFETLEEKKSFWLDFV